VPLADTWRNGLAGLAGDPCGPEREPLPNPPATLGRPGELLVDFADAQPPESSLRLLEEHPRLLVFRTFSKAWGLAGLRIEDPNVFEETHATLFRLYADGLIDGFRVDHVDGLSDPPGYCRRLRERLDELAPGRRAYLVVEKILGAGETLPTDWGVDGTSGYDFMNEVSAVQHADSTHVSGVSVVPSPGTPALSPRACIAGLLLARGDVRARCARLRRRGEAVTTSAPRGGPSARRGVRYWRI